MGGGRAERVAQVKGTSGELLEVPLIYLGMDCEVPMIMGQIWPIVHVGTCADTFEEGSGIIN